MMSGPFATQEALPTAVGVAYLSFMTSLPPEVVLGAFTGSVIFLLGIQNKPKWQWLLYFSLAFIAGLLGANIIAQIAEGLLNILRIKVEFPLGLGAMVSAACTVNVISWFRDNPAFFFTRKKGERA